MAYAQAPGSSLPARPTNSSSSSLPPHTHAPRQQAYATTAPGRGPPFHGQYSAAAGPSYSSQQLRIGQLGPNHSSPYTPSQTAGYGQAGHATSRSSYSALSVSTNALDSSEAAQIAEWQSAYNSAPNTAGANFQSTAALQTRDGTESRHTEYPASSPATATTDAQDRKKTVSRQGGGKKWTDDTLLEWDPSHLRLFVGNLAGETTDESLLKAFSRWRSVQKARVIRDKRTTKSKGYGFVSFSDADDFFQAAKEMNGKYIQSHPVVVKKANTEIKVANVKDKSKGSKNKKNKNRATDDSGGGTNPRAGNTHGVVNGATRGYEPSLGPLGSGITKPGHRTKNGLRLLG